MKKRILTLLLTMIMLVTTLVVPAGAAEVSRFSDVKDRNTETAVETLRLMGVLDGYGDGTFRPDAILTRAQFCKMATFITDSEAELGRYRTITVFPDVKPSHWAVSYINLAAKGKGIIAGYPDGTFQPNRTLTMGHAVTILLRLLDYKDEDVGGVWPDSYMAVADMIGLTQGLPSNGNAPLTREQAAKLFLNLLDTEKKSGGTLYTLSDPTDLRAVDGSAGKLTTADASYTMAHPVTSTLLIGSSGHVVLNKAGKALTFLPDSIASGSGTASAAIVVAADASTAGFAELAGSSSYALYKNGLPITPAELRKNDVASYHPSTNAIRVCDTRVSVYYESCSPSPAAPTKITALGGTEFSVLPSARDALAAFRPGSQITLLLTADGQVAAVATGTDTSTRSNAAGIVSEDGTVHLICGNTLIPLAAKATGSYCGQVVRVAATQKGSLTLSSLTGGVGGDLNVSEKTLGKKKLADNVMIFDYGQQITLSDLNATVVSRTEITYARTNWAGEIDLLVLHAGSGDHILYGHATVRETTHEEDGNIQHVTTVEVTSGDRSTGAIETNYYIKNNSYVAAVVKDGRFTMLRPLTDLKNITPQSWVGTNMIVYNGQSYSVGKNILCHNADSGEWITLEQALAYSDTVDIYVTDNIVRIIVVSYHP